MEDANVQQVCLKFSFLFSTETGWMILKVFIERLSSFSICNKNLCRTSHFLRHDLNLDILKLLTAELILSVSQEYFIIGSWFIFFSKYQVESGLLPFRD